MLRHQGGCPEINIETVSKDILPFFLAMVVCVIILIVFSQIALVLPNLR